MRAVVLCNARLMVTLVVSNTYVPPFFLSLFLQTCVCQSSVISGFFNSAVDVLPNPGHFSAKRTITGK